VELEPRRKIPASEVRDFYLEYEKRFPDLYSNGFSGWLGFLEGRGFIRHVDGDIAITPSGLDFLMWLRVNKLSFSRPG
jgi:hypothetical protein